MPSSWSTITATLALLTVVDSSPLSLLKKRGTFSLAQVERAKILKNGPQQKAKTFRKYGVPVPENVLAAAAARADEAATYYAAPEGVNGSVPAVPIEYDALYLTPVTIGKDTLELDFDTGSADLWTFSSLQSPSQLTGRGYYNTTTGTELKNASWSILYGDWSSALGRVYTDTITVGPITFATQAIGAATSVSSAFTRDRDTDGLFGLGFSSKLNTIHPVPQKTFFENVKDTLQEPVFAVALRYHEAGSYDFGFIDKKKYEGEITWLEANTTQGWWAFSPTAYTVNGKDTDLTFETIGDTGTTVSYFPTTLVTDFYASIPGAENSYEAGGWIFPCNASVPDFGLTIGGTKFAAPGKHLNFAPVTTDGLLCYGGIQDQESMRFGIVGDTILKSLYMVHEDRPGGKPRVGFAKQVGLL